jgi:hypothetical protein
VDEQERRKAENREAAHRLISYPQMVDDYTDAVERAVYARISNANGIRAGVSDPTATRAMRLVRETGNLRNMKSYGKDLNNDTWF